jgi:hypothetical protein
MTRPQMTTGALQLPVAVVGRAVSRRFLNRA